MIIFAMICLLIVGIGILFVSGICNTVQYYREERMRGEVYAFRQKTSYFTSRLIGAVLATVSLIAILLFEHMGL